MHILAYHLAYRAPLGAKAWDSHGTDNKAFKTVRGTNRLHLTPYLCSHSAGYVVFAATMSLAQTLMALQ
jgi:hypothetical protein